VEYYVVVVLLMSFLTFVLYGIDKRKASKKTWRISEKTLFLFAFLFGSVGAVAGMLLFRHKTKHTSFILFNGLMLIIHIGLGIFLLLQGY
jgi:uncharacterized membrane protein YsdA (DUF1294 family)